MSNAIVPVVPKRNAVTGAGYPTSLTLGELAVNTTTGNVYLGADPGVVRIGIPVAAGTTLNLGTGDGSTVAFAITGGTGTDAGGYLVSVGGIDQPSGWTVAGTTLTFSEAPPAGASVSVRAILKGEGGGGGGTDIGGRAWSAGATYTEGDLVATSQRETWICIQNANTGNDPATSPTWWAPQPADAVSLQLRAVTSDPPSDRQAIAWDATNNVWKPTTLLQIGTEGLGGYPVSSGIKIGNNTVSHALAIGEAAYANPYQSNNGSGDIAIGQNAIASYNSSIAIGASAQALQGGIAIGAGASSDNGMLALSATLLQSGVPNDPLTPSSWLLIKINGSTYRIPLYV